MASDAAKILRLLEKLMNIEEKISTEIKKEKDAKRREKLLDAVKDRDASVIRDLWFNP